VEVAASSSGTALPYGLIGGNAGYAVKRNLIVQGGVDGSLEGYTMAWGGVQVPGRLHLSRRWSLAADGEVGVGAGVGGERVCGDEREDCVDDNRPWYRRAAGGGYLGVGGAVRAGPVSMYARARTQMTDATGIPVTLWASGLGGFHFHILDKADIWLGSGMARYSNAYDSRTIWVSEIGLAFRFDPYVGWRR